MASTMNEADRAAAAGGLMVDDGLRIELVEPEPDVYNMAYNVVSNAMLWFCHHHLFDAARRPRADQRWLEAWDAYREFNQLFAERVAKVAPRGRPGPGPGLPPGPDGPELARLATRSAHHPLHPHPVRRSVGAADAAHRGGRRAAGLHGRLRCLRVPHRAVGRVLPGRPATMAATVRPAAAHLRLAALHRRRRPGRRSAARTVGGRALARIEERVGGSDRQVIVRVDRMELSKNLLRGFWAFEELLALQPTVGSAWSSWPWPTPPDRGFPNISPTRTRSSPPWPDQRAVGHPGWTPIVLEVEDDYPRSLAALTRYDVLLVNPVRDGLNLVAKEGPLVNTRNGVLALSREAGAFDELDSAALEVNPFDVSGTAAVIAEALDMDADPAGHEGRAAPTDHPVHAIRRTGSRLSSTRPADPALGPRPTGSSRRQPRAPNRWPPLRPTRPGPPWPPAGPARVRSAAAATSGSLSSSTTATATVLRSLAPQGGQCGEGRKVAEVVAEVARRRAATGPAR